MNAIEFYNVTKEKLDSLASEKGVKHLERYYKLTDYTEAPFLKDFSERAQVVAQMAFHAQNATMLSNIVKFKQNINFLKQVFFNFEPDDILKEYPVDQREDSVRKLVDALRFTEEKGNGLKWNSNKSSPAKKDFLITRYANSVLDCASFVGRFKGRQEFINDLLVNYPNKESKVLIQYFRNQVSHGFSIALTCDFLKELSLLYMSKCENPDLSPRQTPLYLSLLLLFIPYRYKVSSHKKGKRSSRFPFCITLL